MKFIFLVWTFCLLNSYGQANVNFEIHKPTPADKSEDSIWYHFGPHHCHAPYVVTAQFLPIIHPKAPWLVLGYTSVYYLLKHFTPFFGRFCLLGHLLHMLMIGIPVGSTLVKFNLGALLHSIRESFPMSGSLTPQEVTILHCKVSPILWWALSSGPVGCLPSSSPETTIGWLPEIAQSRTRDQSLVS
ncbi:hypothetical protein DSO57_1026024 [Entomophthora muscae]|uniref:Uncharacterized protein n=1 Tax=Entomophthora muscae TaxID=34485 RepID=A0ACC2TP73_9FUNG|nr:hypothetical protein DSO57_1026024 [Entomophthora muscae]